MPRGGIRKGAGRPKGQGKYGEKTKAIRVPISKSRYISEIVSNGLYEIPLYGNKVAAGFPSPADDYLEEKIDIRENCKLNRSSSSVKPSAPVDPKHCEKEPPVSPPKYQDEYGYNNNHRISLYPKIDNESIY